jgi:hypothetical protein
MRKSDRTNYHGLSKSSLIATITQLEMQHDADGIRLRDEARYIKRLEEELRIAHLPGECCKKIAAERDELKQELEAHETTIDMMQDQQIKVCAERDELKEKLEREEKKT